MVGLEGVMVPEGVEGAEPKHKPNTSQFLPPEP